MDELTHIHSLSHRIHIQQQQQEEEVRSIRSMAYVAGREAAVREVAQVYELIKLQQPLLLLHCSSSSPPSTTQLAQSLLGKALRALNVALSVMKQQQPSAAPVTPISVVRAEPHQLSPSSPASADSEAVIAPSTATRGAKRRRSSSVAMEGKKKTSSSSWTTFTAVPYDDGYEWRKYGEKKINGTLFTRSYFRCTYKQDDAGCLATKHVQQMDNNDSDLPMFQVTYNNHHTCSSAKAAAPNNAGSNSSGSGKGLTTANARPTGHAAAAAAMNMKQEPPLLLLPPLVEPSTCFPYDQMMPQRQEPLFPTSMEQQFVCGALRDHHDSPVDGGIPSATGSCISGETSWWDGYGDMATQMAAEDDDPLHHLDRFLQCDSFMDY